MLAQHPIHFRKWSSDAFIFFERRFGLCLGSRRLRQEARSPSPKPTVAAKGRRAICPSPRAGGQSRLRGSGAYMPRTQVAGGLRANVTCCSAAPAPYSGNHANCGVVLTTLRLAQALRDRGSVRRASHSVAVFSALVGRKWVSASYGMKSIGFLSVVARRSLASPLFGMRLPRSAVADSSHFRDPRERGISGRSASDVAVVPGSFGPVHVAPQRTCRPTGAQAERQRLL